MISELMNFLEAKPVLSHTLTVGGVTTNILGILNIINPIVACIAGIGALVIIYCNIRNSRLDAEIKRLQVEELKEAHEAKRHTEAQEKS